MKFLFYGLILFYKSVISKLEIWWRNISGDTEELTEDDVWDTENTVLATFFVSVVWWIVITVLLLIFFTYTAMVGDVEHVYLTYTGETIGMITSSIYGLFMSSALIRRLYNNGKKAHLENRRKIIEALS